MSRLRIVIFILLVAVFIGVYVYYRNASLPTVSLDAKGSVYTFYNSVDKKPIAEISSPTTLKLHDGYYCGETKDTNFDNKPLCFTVYLSDISYTFDANYSHNRLSKLLIPEQTAINKSINSTYVGIIKNYTVCNGALYAKGDIYGAVIIAKVSNRSENSDVYRVVLKKTNGSWNIIKTPVIVLDKKTFSDIPFDILQKINSQNACENDELLEGYSTPAVNQDLQLYVNQSSE